MDSLTTRHYIIIGLVFIVLVAAVMYYWYHTNMASEGLVNKSPTDSKPAHIKLDNTTHPYVVDADMNAHHTCVPCTENHMDKPIHSPDYNSQVEPHPAIQEYVCPPAHDDIKPEELMPKTDPQDVWNYASPNNPGCLEDKNFLESGYHHGINTVGSSRKNANYQIRSDPPNPRVPVSIWHQSTIEPDTNRRMMEIGEA